MENQIETYTIVCKPQYINFLYCTLINRISRGWSARELSFLLGQDDDFIGNLERFIDFDYSAELMGQLFHIIPEGNLLMTSVNGVSEFTYQHTISIEGNLIRYRMEMYINEYESVIVFDLVEEDGSWRDQSAPNSVKEELMQAGIILDMLLKEGNFSKYVTALEIFNTLKTHASSYFQPKQLKTELDKLWGRKGTAPLKRTKRRSYGYRFIMHK